MLKSTFTLLLTILLLIPPTFAVSVTLKADFTNDAYEERVGTLSWFIEPTNGGSVTNVTKYCLQGTDSSKITVPAKDKITGIAGTAHKECTITDESVLTEASYYTYAELTYKKGDAYYTFQTEKSPQFSFGSIAGSLIGGLNNVIANLFSKITCDKNPELCSKFEGDNFCFLSDSRYQTIDADEMIKELAKNKDSKLISIPSDYESRIRAGCLPKTLDGYFDTLKVKSVDCSSNGDKETCRYRPGCKWAKTKEAFILGLGEEWGCMESTDNENCNYRSDGICWDQDGPVTAKINTRFLPPNVESGIFSGQTIRYDVEVTNLGDEEYSSAYHIDHKIYVVQGLGPDCLGDPCTFELNLEGLKPGETKTFHRETRLISSEYKGAYVWVSTVLYGPSSDPKIAFDDYDLKLYLGKAKLRLNGQAISGKDASPLGNAKLNEDFYLNVDVTAYPESEISNREVVLEVTWTKEDGDLGMQSFGAGSNNLDGLKDGETRSFEFQFKPEKAGSYDVYAEVRRTGSLDDTRIDYEKLHGVFTASNNEKGTEKCDKNPQECILKTKSVDCGVFDKKDYCLAQSGCEWVSEGGILGFFATEKCQLKEGAVSESNPEPSLNSDQLARDIFDKVNQERRSKGLSEISWDDGYHDIASSYARKLSNKYKNYIYYSAGLSLNPEKNELIMSSSCTSIMFLDLCRSDYKYNGLRGNTWYCEKSGGSIPDWSSSEDVEKSFLLYGEQCNSDVLFGAKSTRGAASVFILDNAYIEYPTLGLISGPKLAGVVFVNDLCDHAQETIYKSSDGLSRYCPDDTGEQFKQGYLGSDSGFFVCDTLFDHIVDDAKDCCDGSAISGADCEYAVANSNGDKKTCEGIFVIQAFGPGERYLKGYDTELYEAILSGQYSQYHTCYGGLINRVVNNGLGICETYARATVSALRMVGYEKDEAFYVKNDKIKHAFCAVKFPGSDKYTFIDNVGNSDGFIEREYSLENGAQVDSCSLVPSDEFLNDAGSDNNILGRDFEPSDFYGCSGNPLDPHLAHPIDVRDICEITEGQLNICPISNQGVWILGKDKMFSAYDPEGKVISSYDSSAKWSDGTDEVCVKSSAYGESYAGVYASIGTGECIISVELNGQKATYTETISN